MSVNNIDVNMEYALAQVSDFGAIWLLQQEGLALTSLRFEKMVGSKADCVFINKIKKGHSLYADDTKRWKSHERSNQLKKLRRVLLARAGCIFESHIRFIAIASDTVFFRQARFIQELAKRDFENLRQKGEDGELQPKVVRRGRPPGKHVKKGPRRPPLDRVGPECTSGARYSNNRRQHNRVYSLQLKKSTTRAL
nr:bromodomain-containing protein [Tanacetum cinerariifolium]